MRSSSKDQQLTENFLNLIVSLGYFSKRRKLLFKLSEFFNSVELKDKKVLDIGGGYGLLSFYAAVSGAEIVICVEPEAEGSIKGIQNKFNLIKDNLGIKNIILSHELFQTLAPTSKFDIIILHNSINHLNEKACMSLLYNSDSYSEYRKYFEKMNDLLNENGELIISDGSSANLWGDLKLKNFFANTINWKIHQPPTVWKNLLEKTGFYVTKVKWNSFNTLGQFGKVIFGNKFFSYFFTSHFTLYAKKVTFS